MMKIISYVELSKQEQEHLLGLLQESGCGPQTELEMAEAFTSAELGRGEGVFACFGPAGECLGKASLILAEVGLKQIGYCLEIVLSQSDDRLGVLRELLDHAKGVGEAKGLRRVLVGTPSRVISEMLESLGYEYLYSGVKMVLEDLTPMAEPLREVPLMPENKATYVEVFNASFAQTPNGGTLTMDETDDVLSGRIPGKHCAFAYDSGRLVGFFQVTVGQGQSDLDIGLLPEARGQGLGRRLLETAIAKLKELGASEAHLTVITGNEAAYPLYQKRGFQVVKTLNQWYAQGSAQQ